MLDVNDRVTYIPDGETGTVLKCYEDGTILVKWDKTNPEGGRRSTESEEDLSILIEVSQK